MVIDLSTKEMFPVWDILYAFSENGRVAPKQRVSVSLRTNASVWAVYVADTPVYVADHHSTSCIKSDYSGTSL